MGLAVTGCDPLEGDGNAVRHHAQARSYRTLPPYNLYKSYNGHKTHASHITVIIYAPVVRLITRHCEAKN